MSEERAKRDENGFSLGEWKTEGARWTECCLNIDAKVTVDREPDTGLRPQAQWQIFGGWLQRMRRVGPDVPKEPADQGMDRKGYSENTAAVRFEDSTSQDLNTTLQVSLRPKPERSFILHTSSKLYFPKHWFPAGAVPALDALSNGHEPVRLWQWLQREYNCLSHGLKVRTISRRRTQASE